MTTNGYVGSLQGQFAVDHSGGAVYTIPLTLPPGTAGVMPSLSLVYSSGGGNGILGMGWTLRGLSSITRAAATMAQDGFIGAVNYDGEDRFALDGQRLVPVSGAAYQDPSAVYHTELERWNRVVPVYGDPPTAGRSGPDAFVVSSKRGKRLEYGTSPDAQVLASSANPSIRVWALNKITDLNGNFVSFTYQQDVANGMFCPLAIEYTGNAGTGLAPQRSVQFTYEGRPDPWVQYQGGSPVGTTQRLTAIQTYLGGQLVMTYSFTYQTGQSTGRSQLQSVTQSDANGVALSPTVFTWQDGDPGILAASQTLPETGAPWQGRLLPMDVNGDGRTDLVNAYSAGGYLGLTLFLSDGAGFSPPAGIVLPPTQLSYYEGAQVVPLDVNGDGCMDLVYAWNNNGKVALTVLLAQPDGQGGWTFTPGEIDGGAPSDINWGPLIAMDVNGDGLVDLVIPYDNGGTLGLQTLFSNGATFAPSSQDQTAVNVSYYAGAQVLPIRINGDAMCDLLYAYQDGAAYDVVLLLSQGLQGFVQQATSPVPASTTLPFPGLLTVLDVNGDGMGDLVHVSLDSGALVLQTLLSTGGGLTDGVAQSFPLTNPATSIPLMLPTEIRGAGVPDLIIATQGGGQVSLQVLSSTSSGFVAQDTVTQPSASIPWGAAMLPMDVAGDGRGGLVYAYESSSNLALGHSPASGAYPDLIATITNGLGGQIALTYQPLTNPGVYSKGAPASQQIEAAALVDNRVSGATYPLGGPTPTPTPGVTYATHLVDFPKYVVAAYDKSDGRGNAYRFTYFYTGAKVDLTGRGWLGFESVQVTDPQYLTATLTAYNQLFPETGTVKSNLITRSSDGAWMHLTEIAYLTPSPSPGVYQCVHGSVQTSFYTFAPPPASPTSPPTPDDTHTLNYLYDAYGNVIQTEDIGASTVYLLQTYDNDPTQWLLGYETERKLTADQAGTQILSLQHMAVYPGTQNLAAHQVWDDQHQLFLVTAYTYDAYGNVTATTDASGAVTTTAYDSTYQTFVAEATAPPNAAGVSLVSRSTYYPEFGVLGTRTDSNGVTFQQQVDGLGRVVQRLGPDPSSPSTQVVLTKQNWLSGPDGAYLETQRCLDWAGTGWVWAQQYVDGLSRVYKTAALGPDGTTTVIVDTEFDSRNNVVGQSLPYYEGAPPVSMQRRYDNYARLLQAVYPVDGGTATTTIDYLSTNTLVKTEAAGTPDARATTFVYGTFHSKRLVVKRIDANQAVTTYTYDPTGRIIQSVDPFPVTNTATYDSMGRQITLTSQSGDTVLFAETFAHDDLNGQIVHTYASGAQVVLTYDALKRLVEKTAGAQTTTFTYDVPGQAYGQGRVGAVAATDGTTYTYQYDPYGNQSEIIVATAGASHRFQMTHTPTRQVQQLTYPDAGVLTNGYNAAGRLETVSVAEPGQAATTFATYGQFTPIGAPEAVAYGNAVQETLGYNPVGQLTSQLLSGPGGTFQNRTLSWNPFNAVAAVGDQVSPANSQAFTYDAVGRLQQATGGYPAQTYGYDDAGNVTSKEGVAYSYTGYQVNQGTQNGQAVWSAQYDADGNMAAMTSGGASHSLVYDAERQLVQAEGATFTYDYTGRRLTKQAPNGPTTVYATPFYEVATMPDGSTQRTKYVTGTNGLIATITIVDWGQGNPVDNPFTGVPVPGTCYFHKDHLGSTTAVTSDTGQVVTTVEYLPYGEIGAITGPNTFRYKFTGKELDPETGLYYFRSRYYDPAIGRFITADSQLGGQFHMQDVFNRYAYALNSPVTHVDPTGHSVWSDISHFFDYDIGHFFKTQWQNVVSFVVDAALVIGGVFLLATTPFGGALSTVIGSALLGAGISGLTYNISHLATHQQFSWAGWGEQLGIGAASGLIAGGVAAGASAAVGAISSSYLDVAASIGNESDAAYQAATRAAAMWAPRGAARIAANTVAATIGNGASGAVGGVLNNLATHTSRTKGLGWDTLIGAVTGAVAGGLSEGIGAKLAKRFSSWDEIEQGRDPVFDDDASPWKVQRLAAKDGTLVLPDNTWTNAWLGLPGTVFSGADAYLTSSGTWPAWW